MENQITIHYIENERISLDLPITRAQADQEISHLTHQTKDFELHLIEMIPNLFDFYAAQLEADDETPAGYKWSSRCSIMNKYFGIELIDVDCYYADNKSTPERFGFRVSELKKILPEEYTIVKNFYDKEDKEPYFKVVKKTLLQKYLDRNYMEV